MRAKWSPEKKIPAVNVREKVEKVEKSLEMYTFT